MRNLRRRIRLSAETLDDYLVALARAAVVDAPVTGGRDLLELEDIGVAVITPRKLVERLADAP